MQLSGLLPGLEQNSISCSGLAGTFITRSLGKPVEEGSSYLTCPKQLQLQGDWDIPCNWLRPIISSLWIKTKTQPLKKSLWKGSWGSTSTSKAVCLERPGLPKRQKALEISSLPCSAEHRPQLSCSAPFGEKRIKLKKAGPCYCHQVFRQAISKCSQTLRDCQRATTVIQTSFLQLPLLPMDLLREHTENFSPARQRLVFHD